MLSRKISGGLSGLALVNPSPSRSSSRRHGMLFCETFYHEHSNGARLAGLLTSLGLFYNGSSTIKLESSSPFWLQANCESKLSFLLSNQPPGHIRQNGKSK